MSVEFRAFALILLVAAPVMLPALDSYFTFDDMMNLDYYLDRPQESLYSNLLLFTSFRRPLGALFYLPCYYLWGMNPFPFYLTGLLFIALNLGLFYALTLRLTRSLAIAVGAAAMTAFQPYIRTLTYNFGSVYELAALTGVLGGMHCYLWLVSRPRGDPSRKWWYAGTLVCYWMALNAKETAVVLPALLLAYELSYRFVWNSTRPPLAGAAKRLAPMFAVAGIYTLVKVLGDEAYWRTNPLYVYHFDSRILDNLATYGMLASYQNFRFDAVEVVVAAVALAVAGLLLRNRHVLFGLAAALLTFLPILPLPRVWTLFLYLPSVGLTLCLSALLVDVLTRLWKRAAPGRWTRWRPTPLVRLILVTIFLTAALARNIRDFRAAHEIDMANRIGPWRSFARQLYERFPDFADESVVGFEDPPFNPDGFDQWCPHFLVRLGYPDRRVRVYWLPQQEKEFRKAASTASQAYWLDWQDGRMVGKSW